MKKHLWLGGALILAGFAAAQSAQACSTFSITNATGSPPVVAGSTVNVFAWGWAPSSFINIDGFNYTYYDVFDPSPTPFPIQGSFLVPTYGTHTMWSSIEPSCVLTFTTVAPEPPPAKYDAPTLSDTGAGVACPVDVLQWTAATGATTYELWQRQLAPALDPALHQVWSTANRSKSVRVARGAQFVYAVRACGPDKNCSDLSNTASVVGGICP